MTGERMTHITLPGDPRQLQPVINGLRLALDLALLELDQQPGYDQHQRHERLQRAIERAIKDTPSEGLSPFDETSGQRIALVLIDDAFRRRSGDDL